MWMNSISLSFHRCFSYKKKYHIWHCCIVFFFSLGCLFITFAKQTKKTPKAIWVVWFMLLTPITCTVLCRSLLFLKEKGNHVKTPFAICKYECICVYTDVFNHTFLSREIKSHISEMISELRQQFSLVFMSSRCDIKGVYILSMVVNQVSWFCFSSSY